MWNAIQDIWLQFIGLMKTFQIQDCIDILLVAFLIYKLIQLIRDTRAAQLVKGILIVVVIYGLVLLFDLKMMTNLFLNFLPVALYAMVVIFQPELRRALEQLGRSKIGNFKLLNINLRGEDDPLLKNQRAIKAVADACQMLRNMKMGALIVFERESNLGEIIKTGTAINADPSAELIGNVFFNKAPLHDGAMIIRDFKICAAGCILPLTQNARISSELGTRHRAAIGMSEVSDAVVVVVSEETGNISVARNGMLTRNYTKDTLRNTLEHLLLPQEGHAAAKRPSSIRPSKRKVNKNER